MARLAGLAAEQERHRPGVGNRHRARAALDRRDELPSGYRTPAERTRGRGPRTEFAARAGVGCGRANDAAERDETAAKARRRGPEHADPRDDQRARRGESTSRGRRWGRDIDRRRDEGDFLGPRPRAARTLPRSSGAGAVSRGLADRARPHSRTRDDDSAGGRSDQREDRRVAAPGLKKRQRACSERGAGSPAVRNRPTSRSPARDRGRGAAIEDRLRTPRARRGRGAGQGTRARSAVARGDGTRFRLKLWPARLLGRNELVEPDARTREGCGSRGARPSNGHVRSRAPISTPRSPLLAGRPSWRASVGGPHEVGQRQGRERAHRR